VLSGIRYLYSQFFTERVCLCGVPKKSSPQKTLKCRLFDHLKSCSIFVSKENHICSTIYAKPICTNQSAYIPLSKKIINILPKLSLELLQSDLHLRKKRHKNKKTCVRHPLAQGPDLQLFVRKFLKATIIRYIRFYSNLTA